MMSPLAHRAETSDVCQNFACIQDVLHALLICEQHCVDAVVLFSLCKN